MREVKFKLGGLERRTTVKLGLALQIEEATGVGIMALVSALARNEARLSHVVEVLRLALAASGQQYSSDDVLEMIEQDGILSASLAAAAVLNGLFYKPPKGRGSGNAAAGDKPATTNTTPAAIQ
jgi:hypothetical protein